MPNDVHLLEPNLTKSNTNKVPTLIRILVLVPDLLSCLMMECYCYVYVPSILLPYPILLPGSNRDQQRELPREPNSW